MRPELQLGSHRVSGLVDVLDRVLDKGLAIAGDIKISLAEVELLTIRIRLIVCSIDKAQEIGLDWWKYDEHFSPSKRATPVTDELRKQIAALEERVALLSSDGRRPAARRAPRAKRK
jgi:Gas vesicle protein